MSNWDSKKYKVKEEYMGKEIIVDVNETWKNGSIDSAMISCPGYSSMIKGISHKVGNYRPCEQGGVIGEIIKRLSVEDVHDAIMKEFLIAERSIASDKKQEHDNFENKRYFHVIVEYEDQEIAVALMIKAGRKEVHIICPSTYMVSSVSMEDNKFRDKIIDEVEKSKKLIDNGYVFPKPGKMSKVKKKIKSLFQ
jgi:hypothetical protein